MLANTMGLMDWASDTSQHQQEYSEIQSIAVHNEVVFEAFYLRYHPRLYRFVYRILNNSSQTEEVVSDTLYAVWNGAEKFKQQSKVSTWVFGIAFRTAMKAARSGSRQGRYSKDSDDPEELLDLDPQNDPANQVEWSDRTSALFKAMDSLSVEQRAVVELTALGWSCTEIGDIVGCPTNTVKTRIFNARKKLKSLLDVSNNNN